ncbi:hypothetical protein GQ457_02G031900 [Hibiscus cannabinus]
MASMKMLSQGVVSLFVENLPETLHWKGLWHLFARHGDVVNVYIVRKQSRGGKRFGLVRMKDKENVDRVIERLHGFFLYGARLTIKVASKGYDWKRKHADKSQIHGADLFGSERVDFDKSCKVEAMVPRVSNTEEYPGRENMKRIFGHVENEELWNLGRCLVGEIETVCSMSSIHSRVMKWGLGEINVQRLVAKTFMLTIEDEDLFLMLEDVGWSYLMEIFNDVRPWSEQASYSKRATCLAETELGSNIGREEATASLGKVTTAGHNDGVLKPMRQASKVQKVASYVKLDHEVIIDGESPSKMYLYHHDPEADTGKGPNENVMDTQAGPEAVIGDEVFNDSKNDWANSLDKFFNSGKDLNSFAKREFMMEQS